MLNKTVFHKSFGKGTIISQERGAGDKKYITVDFGDKKTKFQFPDAFESFLTTEDEEINSILKNAGEKRGGVVDPINRNPIWLTNAIKAATERTVCAQTNAEFLNSEFGTKYEQWYKSTWEHSSYTVVWMGFVDGKERDNWVNFWADKEHTVMIEEYEGHDSTIAERAIKYNYRIIAEKDFSSYNHRYYVRGLFIYDAKESSTYKHVWRKIKCSLDFII